MQDDLHSAHISVRRGNILLSGDMILNGEVNLWIQMRRFVSGEFTFTDDEWEASVTDRGVKTGDVLHAGVDILRDMNLN